MTTSEFLSAHAAHDDTAGFDRGTGLDFFARNGLDLSRFPEKMRSGNGYRRGVPAIPRQYRRLMDGDRLSVGGHDWQVITLFGHAPEHAALWCASRNILISGDQVLPRITTNVGVWGNQPEANPLETGPNLRDQGVPWADGGATIKARDQSVFGSAAET